MKSFIISFLLGGIVREGSLFLWRLLVLYWLKAFTGFKQGPNRGIDFQTGGWLGPAEYFVCNRNIHKGIFRSDQTMGCVPLTSRKTYQAEYLVLLQNYSSHVMFNPWTVGVLNNVISLPVT